MKKFHVSDLVVHYRIYASEKLKEMHCMSQSYTLFYVRELLRKEFLRMSESVHICSTFVKDYKIHLGKKSWLMY